MSTQEKKRIILQAGMEKQEKIIRDFQARIDDLSDSTRLMNDAQIDAQQASHNGENDERIVMLNGQLSFVEEEMQMLHRLNLDAPRHDSVHMGSVVVTDRRTFFISVSLEEFEVNGEKIFGISTKAPLYAEMRGKLKGDSFEYNGTKYQIEDIY